ncbi:hypothetical protein PR202_gb26875 [Eleusine coracana subsp. coracana]|uniref:Uncharacterized protein n=1 Tax=Eleusine coracana subsp. coracana TaxID=191504 RepID=A0AAV5FSP4_ELECO|nr:hypothetical protein QOZ80_1BG0053180 [Eleusine coracana subsp. coracana]GJN37878.1 hypothetical protein PR202_gb26875 [Eleusine coracana subsp. coracana]
MEAAVASGILNIIGNKLAPLLIKEYSSIVGVREDLQELQDLVKEINNWLISGYTIMGDDQSFNWIKKLKSVAYAVDDVVDEFQMKSEKHDAYGDGGIVTKYMCTKPKSFIFHCKAASKIKAIKMRFASIVKERTDISAIANCLSFGHPMNNTNAEMPTLPTVDATSIVGRDEDKHHIISMLAETDHQHNVKIVSVIGLGGTGKTTLAKLIINDSGIIKKHFEVRLWVHVSQEFDVQKLIKKLFDAFADSKSEQHPLQYMIDSISKKLAKKRFLLVLDDVWTEDRIKWEEFIVHLKGSAPGSSILLTTRSRNVAEAVKSAHMFGLPFLSEAGSWQVFEQSYGTVQTALDTNFLEVGRDIVNNCGGVPLAIKILAGILRGKKRIEEWQAVRESNLLHVEDKEHRVSECLKLSYFHLQSHLKQCFTSCSVFPKGYRLDREQLIDQWIAHDLITPVIGVDCLEYSAKRCFSSLVEMSFLQDVDEKDDGRVECTMHDLVHDLAQSIVGDEISLVLPKDVTSSTKTCRYFSLMEESSIIAPINIFEKARAIYISVGDDFIFGKALKNARHLRSITVKYANTEMVPASILHAKNLRYLCISGSKFQTLPEAISAIWSLQALYVNSPKLHELPESIGKLKKLRTLNLSGCAELITLPDSIGDCLMISILNLYYCEKLMALPDSIIKNKNLRVLRLGLTKIKRLPPGIIALENLECLDLWLCHVLEELPEGIGNLKKLEVLNVDGCDGLRSMPAGIGQLSRLQKLGLFVVGKGESSAEISELGNIDSIGGELIIRNIPCRMYKDDAYEVSLKKKTKLQKLTLNWGINDFEWCRVDTEAELSVLNALEPPSGITCLQIERYLGEEYGWWMLEQVGGGVQGLHRYSCLTVMRLRCCTNLKHLKGLVELPCLVELELSDMPCLESISVGTFPSLVKLVMKKLPRLREVWMVRERDLAGRDDRGMQIGTSVSYLHIEECPELKVKPDLPSSLEHLRVHRSSFGLLLLPGRITTLRSMFISGCSFITRLPIWFEQLQFLQEMDISSFDSLRSLPQSMSHLTSLQVLRIARCQALCQLPECLGELPSLRKFEISDLQGLTCLPESMGQLASLEELHIRHCASLSSLPDWIKDLTTLQVLCISFCPDLKRRCKRGKGEDWHLISYISHLQIE